MTDEITRKKLSEFKLDPDNANIGSSLDFIEQSVGECGPGRSITAANDLTVVAGNQTVQALRRQGYEDILVVKTDGKTPVAVVREDWKDASNKTARRYAYYDNRSSEFMAWDFDQVRRDIEAGIDLSGIWSEGEIERMRGEIESGLDDIEDPEEADPEFTGVPDTLFPTDNDLDIPVLDINMQADAADAPFELWGEVNQKTKMRGTWLFYVDDFKLTNLWTHPELVFYSACVNCSEVNWSTNDQMPLVVGLWGIFRKRWLARYWQSKGIRTFVDLNVASKFREANLLGVPFGWKAYMTRGYTVDCDILDIEYQIACERAQTSQIWFVVYGGGREVKELALKRNWIWLPEKMSRRRRDGV